MKDSQTIHPILSLAAEYDYALKHGSTERQIAQALQKNICNVAEWTIEETALSCHVSISTLRRFLKSMGYDSFTEFQSRISEVLINHDFLSPAAFEATPEGLDKYVEETALTMIRDLQRLSGHMKSEDFIKAAGLLHDSRMIFLHNFANLHMCLALQSNLAMDGKDVAFSDAPTHQYSDALAADPSCTYIILYDGHARSRNVVHTIPRIHRQGGKIILITEDSGFVHKNLCDIVIYTGTGSMVLSSITLYELAFMYLSETYKTLYLSGKQLILKKYADE